MATNVRVVFLMLVFALCMPGVAQAMNKGELIDAVADKSGIDRAAASRAVDAVLGSIAGSLRAGEDVALVGFGTFQVKHRAREWAAERPSFLVFLVVSDDFLNDEIQESLGEVGVQVGPYRQVF